MPGAKGKDVAIIAPSTARRAYPLHLPHFPTPKSRGVAVESYPMTSPPTDKLYDEQLLAQAPEVTKADLQGGYNPDILAAPGPLSSRVLSPDSDADHHDVESARSSPHSKEKALAERPGSFWKTRKGIIVIASLIVLIVVILAAVLGGVLGSRKHGHSQNAPSAPGNGTNGQGGEGGSNEGTMSLTSSASTTISAQPVSSSSSSASSNSSSQGVVGR